MKQLTIFQYFIFFPFDKMQMVSLAKVNPLKGLINVFCNWYVQSFFPEVVSENSYFDDLGDSIKRLVLITYIPVVVKIC